MAKVTQKEAVQEIMNERRKRKDRVKTWLKAPKEYKIVGSICNENIFETLSIE